MTYPALYRAMRQLVSDSLEIVKHKFGDPPQWPQDSFREVTFSPPGGTNTSVVLRPYPTQGLSTAWAEIKTLPSFETTQTELKKLESEGKAVGHWSGDLVAAYAFPILERYIHAGLPLLFQEEGFARCYEEIESYLSASSLSARIFLQLRGLQGSLNSVQLDTDHRLFQIDEETARRLWIRSTYAKLPASQSTNLYLGVMQNISPLLPGHFVLEVKFRYPKEHIREMSSLLKGQIDSSSTALRLSHPGSGFIRFHSYEHIGFFPETGIYGFMEDPNYNQFAYTIDAGVAERLQRRWADSLLIANLFEGASADLSNHLRVAIQRLNASCDKKIAPDKLLDFMIAVEALVSRERDAVSYRVALRVCNARLERKPRPVAVLFFPIMLSLSALSRLGHIYAVISEVLLICATISIVLLLIVGPPVRLRKRALPKPDIRLNIERPSN